MGNLPRVVWLGIPALETKLLAIMNTSWKILPSKEVKILGKNLKLYRDFKAQI